MSHQHILQLVHELGLQAHPEGGWYREIVRSGEQVVNGRGDKRSAVTSIYFLLAAGTFSRWHRVFSDEIWHFLEGEPLELFMIDPDFTRIQTAILAPLARDASVGAGDTSHATGRTPLTDDGTFLDSGGRSLVEGREKPCCLVPAGWWQACRPLGAYGLAACTVAPGFEFDDFSFLSETETGDQRLTGLDPSLLHLL